MKKQIFKIITAAAFAFCLLTSCATEGYVVNEQMNEPVYVRPAAPGPDYVWISGDWVRGGSGYTWQQGYWSRPRTSRVYVPGRWQSRRGGYTWQKGYWRR